MIELRNFEIMGDSDFKLRINELIIKSGQFIQICGNNNTGKSLLLKTIAGFHREYTGELLYNGISEKPGEYGVLLIDSFPAILPRKTVKENLYLPLRKLSSRKQKNLEDLLIKSGLKEYLPSKIDNLSRSKKKSLEFIRAVIQQPHFILFDDFDTYFDNESLDNLTGAFDYAAKTGTALIITTRKRFSGIVNNYQINDGELVKQ